MTIGGADNQNFLNIITFGHENLDKKVSDKRDRILRSEIE